MGGKTTRMVFTHPYSGAPHPHFKQRDIKATIARANASRVVCWLLDVPATC